MGTRLVTAGLIYFCACGGDDTSSTGAAGSGSTSPATSTGPSPASDATGVDSGQSVGSGDGSTSDTSGPGEDSTSTTGALSGSLDIYWIDTEGGAATLIVTPDGPLVLVDAGNPGDRDPDRIANVVQDVVGAEQIDLCIVTHFHSDHVGGVPGVHARVPIVEFWDHGDSVEAGGGGGLTLWQDYLAIASDKRTVVAPGEVHDVGGVQFAIVSAHGATLGAALPGAGGANPACAGASNMPEETNENAMSVGFVATWGVFDFLDIGDLTWSFEDALACRDNLVGAIDLYQTTHHGLAISGATQLVHGIDPVVAVMNNGPHKGGAPESFDIVTSAPSVPDLWMIHRALDADDAHNSEDDLIANPGENEADEGHYIHAHVEGDGTITITNSRNGHQRAYQAR